MTRDHLLSLYERINQAQAASLSLCLPRRMSMDAPQQWIHHIDETYFQGAIGLASKKFEYSDRLARIILDDFPEGTKALGGNMIGLSGMISAQQFRFHDGRIFSLRRSLLRRLEDMGVSNDVPCRFLSSPLPVAFFEFGEPEDGSRPDFGYRTANGDLAEGALVNEYDQVSAGELTDRSREILGVNARESYRVVRVMFSSSPYSASISSLARDDGDQLSFWIIDEDEPIADMVERHFELVRQESRSEFEQMTRRNMEMLVKALLYINGPKPVKEARYDLDDFEKRLATVKNPAKKKKQERRRDRLYDRIILGPSTPYISVAEVNQTASKIPGQKRPHVRRGYMGVRWIGKGRKEARLTRIPHVLVRADLAGEDLKALLEPLDYTVQ